MDAILESLLSVLADSGTSAQLLSHRRDVKTLLNQIRKFYTDHIGSYMNPAIAHLFSRSLSSQHTHGTIEVGNRRARKEIGVGRADAEPTK